MIGFQFARAKSCCVGLVRGCRFSRFFAAQLRWNAESEGSVFRFRCQQSTRQHIKCERDLHVEYRKRFHDKTLLDSGIGKKKP
jgi:hypothetical protein